MEPMHDPTRTAFGTSYFGVRDLDHARADLAAMAATGYAWILLPMTQDDAVWERSTFAQLVALARATGLEPIVSPWGGDDFGGEGIAGPLSVPEWLDRVRATGATTLHVDEPKARSTTIAAVLDQWDGPAWLTIEPHRVMVLDEDTIARVEVLGTDAYDGSVAQRADVTAAFHEATGRLDLAWVQAFRIRGGTEPAVGDAVRAMAGLAPRVGVWGWKGSTGRGDLRSDDPAAVESAVARAIADVRSGGVWHRSQSARQGSARD
jgi:hypothetical protein